MTKNLLINPSGGMSGDIFSAALVSAGADFAMLRKAMEAAGRKLGQAEIQLKETDDHSAQLWISLESQRHHLAGSEGRTFLNELFEEFAIEDKYRAFGMRALEILIKAEKRAHKEFNIVIQEDHHHHHSHDHDHGHDHHHHGDHSHSHSHAHTYEEDAYLHEAQDIVIDIMGAVMGLQLLKAEPKAFITEPVSVGGGHVHCSHGTLSIPAPATTVIMEEHRIPWQKGPVDKELFTPTGAALLAALGGKLHDPDTLDDLKKMHSGRARGTKILPIPPFELFLYHPLNDK